MRAGQSPSLDWYVVTDLGGYISLGRRYVRVPSASCTPNVVLVVVLVVVVVGRRVAVTIAADDDHVPSYLPQAHPGDLTARCISNDSSCVVAGQRCGVPRE